MAVLGIQNFDAMTRRVYLMSKACSAKVLDEALAAAGDVLADALVAATPVGTQSHKAKGGKRRYPGTARASVINVPAKSKSYGITRRLIGCSKSAFYMLWVEKGHQIAPPGKRIARKEHTNKLGGRTHAQGGGQATGMVAGKHFMNRVFRSNIKRAMAVAKQVIRNAVQSQSGKAE